MESGPTDASSDTGANDTPGDASDAGSVEKQDDEVSLNPKDDPAFFNTWRKIISQPPTKPKMRALLRELLSGLTVSLAQVPEAVAFAFTAGVDPIIGLQAAWIVGLIDSIGGGSPGMVSGATGALAVVLPDFVEKNGVGFLFIAVLIMGLLQIAFGILGGGQLIKLIGHPVMIGFCNGLAIVIFTSQFHSFQNTYYCPTGTTCEAAESDFSATGCVGMQSESNTNSTVRCSEWISGATAGFQALQVLVTMATVFLLPKLTKAFPASLAGIVIGTVIEFAIVRPTGHMTPTVKDLGSIQGSFPIPIWVDPNYRSDIPSLGEWDTWRICLPISVTLAVIGLVESLMTMQLVGQITERTPNAWRESIAQGAANVVTGSFGGMGGCAMIGQSMINVKSGGVTRISTIFAASFLLIIILVAYPLINLVPVASLAGVMFMVCYFTFEWSSLAIVLACALPEQWRQHPRVRWIKKIKRSDAIIIVLVTVVAATTNLAIAVGAGVVFSALIFAWDQEKLLEVSAVRDVDDDVIKPGTSFYAIRDTINGKGNGGEDEANKPLLDNDNGVDVTTTHALSADTDPGPIEKTLTQMNAGVPKGISYRSQVVMYQIRGPIFFASSQKFISLFDPHNDPKYVILYLDQTVLSDYSALVAINQMAQKYNLLGKELHLRKATPHSIKVIRKAHHLIYTYDKQDSQEVNENDLLAMELAPHWQQDLPQEPVNKYPAEYSSFLVNGEPEKIEAKDTATGDVKVQIS